MIQPKSEVLQGTLDLVVLKTLDTLGSMHGYGIAQRIQQVSSQMLQLNQGTLYPALLRLEQRGWISSKWGTSDNNRRARFYSLTPAGRRQLARETEGWHRIVDVMGRLLATRGRHELAARVGEPSDGLRAPTRPYPRPPRSERRASVSSRHDGAAAWDALQLHRRANLRVL